MPSGLYFESPQPVYIETVEGDVYIDAEGVSFSTPLIPGPVRGGAGGLPTPPRTGPMKCKKDVRQCPDGSYVSRQGPRCEFQPCPAPKDGYSAELESDLTGVYGAWEAVQRAGDSGDLVSLKSLSEYYTDVRITFKRKYPNFDLDAYVNSITPEILAKIRRDAEGVSLDAFADAVNRRNREAHQDYIDEISKTYLTGAWLGMIAVHNALQNGRFDESLRKQMAQLANAKPIAKATVPPPATTEVTMRFVPTVEGTDPATLPVRFWDMYNSRLASIRASYGSLQSGFVGMDASSVTLRDVSAENYAKVYRVAQDASMNPAFGAEVVFAPFVSAPPPVSGPTPAQIGEESKAGLGAIAPGTPIIGPDGNVIYYGDQERPGGDYQAPPKTPQPPGNIRPGMCYDGFTRGPESLLYLQGLIPLCNEPPVVVPPKPPSVCPVIPPQPPITRYCPPCPPGQVCPDIACIGDIRIGLGWHDNPYALRGGGPVPNIWNPPDPCDPLPPPCNRPEFLPADNPFALHAPAPKVAIPGITPGCDFPPPGPGEGPGDGGGDGNGGGDGDGGGGGGGGGEEEAPPLIPGPSEPGPGGSSGSISGGGGRDDDCGCYCEDDMVVASGPGPGGLTMYCDGKIIYENKKCGGFYLDWGPSGFSPLPRRCL